MIPEYLSEVRAPRWAALVLTSPTWRLKMDPMNNLCKKQGVVVDFTVPVLGRWRQADSLGSLAALADFMSI